MKVKIKVMIMTQALGAGGEFTIEGELKQSDGSKLVIDKKQLDNHDIAGALFAIEFAANDNKNLPMRVHISMEE